MSPGAPQEERRVVPGLVSVVMAAYNCGPFIDEAIRSIRQQTYSQLELQLVDDGSTDDTEAIVRRHMDDPRVHYYKQANAGQTRAKNRAIEESRGEYIAFCDADDLWPANKLDLQLPCFGESPAIGIVYGRVTTINEQGEPLGEGGPPPGLYRSGRLTEDLFKNNIIPFGSAVVKHRCLQEMGAFDEQDPDGHRLGALAPPVDALRVPLPGREHVRLARLVGADVDELEGPLRLRIPDHGGLSGAAS